MEHWYVTEEGTWRALRRHRLLQVISDYGFQFFIQPGYRLPRRAEARNIGEARALRRQGRVGRTNAGCRLRTAHACLRSITMAPPHASNAAVARLRPSDHRCRR